MVYTIDRGLCKAHVMRKLNAAGFENLFPPVLDINAYRY